MSCKSDFISDLNDHFLDYPPNELITGTISGVPPHLTVKLESRRPPYESSADRHVGQPREDMTKMRNGLGKGLLKMGGDCENTDADEQWNVFAFKLHMWETAAQKSLIMCCQTFTMQISDALFLTSCAAFCNTLLLKRKRLILSCPAFHCSWRWKTPVNFYM